ncbi:MAG: LamG-like jellyroll fold domain-containing protein, partial [Candidatus Neomarinimicrobiota bacterium]
DDGAGTTAIDSSDFGNDGTLVGDPQWVTGQLNGALEFDGNGDFVNCGNDASFNIPINITVAAWIKVGTFDRDWQSICTHGDNSWRLHRSGSSNNISWGTSGLTPMDLTGSVNANDGAWHHFAGVYNGTQKILYHMGDVDAAVASTGNIDSSNYNVNIGENNQQTGRNFIGIIDDVRIYRRALTETEIEEIMLGEDRWDARAPNPANGAEDVSIETNLTWMRGDGAKWDLVYFGTDPCDVNLPQVDTIQSIYPAEHDPGDPNLRVSTTYYWYVVEVNGVNTYPGPVWSFTTVRGEAQCEYPLNGTVIPGNIYIPDPNIIFTKMIFIPGATAVKHTGYFNEDYSKVEGRVQDANLGEPPYTSVPGLEYTYYAGNPNVQPADGTLVRGMKYYWTVDETDVWGNTFGGEIWEFAIQGYKAYEPSPPNEALFISPDVLLSWLPGFGAEIHDIYMGTNWQDVNNAVYDATTPGPEFIDTRSEPNYQCSSLAYETKYYWRVDEVTGRLPIFDGTIYKGDVWEFTTQILTSGHREKGYLYLSPLPGAEYVSSQTKFFLVRFEAVSPNDITNLSTFIDVTGQISGTHAGQTRVASDDRTVIFEVSSAFSNDELVTVTLTPTVDPCAAGVVEPYQYQFMVTGPMPPPESALLQATSSGFTALQEVMNRQATTGTKYETLPKVDMTMTDEGGISAAALDEPMIMPNGVSVPSNFPLIDITINDNPDPGYIFLDNRTGGSNSYNVIFDNTGSPIWYLQTSDERRDMKVQHNGVLTMLARTGGYRFVGLDTNYREIASYRAVNGYSTDEHELQVLEDGGYLLIGLRHETVDMTQYLPGANSNASVGQTIIQEFTPEGDLIFQWRAWDNFDVRDVHLDNPYGGSFRFPHMNAIDIDEDGHILLSSRHISEVTKINRDTGEIIWRLSGIPKNNDFTYVNDPLIGFRNQHAIRSTGNGRYLLFDNGDLHSPKV